MRDWSLRANGGGVAGPVVLVVLDGVGLGRGDAGDAVALARTPTLDRLMQGPFVRLRAHGTAVGLPSDDDMGNSEVGHNALGAGRIFDQGAKLVDRALADGSLFAGRAWRDVVGPAASGGALHFLGLLSDGNVHSHEAHLHAMLRQAAREGCRRVFCHVLLDGRDVDAVSAHRYLDRLESVLAELSRGGGTYRVASGGGRMTTTMDRYDADWPMVARGWAVHVHGEGRRFPSAAAAIAAFRAERPGIGDQFLPSFVVADPEPVGPIQDGDGVILWNFRGDRAIEISRAFVEDGPLPFDRGRRPSVRYAGMMLYDGDRSLPPRFLVEPPRIERTMGEHLARNGVSQFACAETQKFGHVTYFWNGNRSGLFEGEEAAELPSDNVPFEQRPWMQAAQVTDRVIEVLARPSPPRLLRVNYANGDMVGHTGDLEAAVLAVQAVDLCLGRLLPWVARRGGAALITADHGNADQMLQIDKKTGALTDAPLTSHTLNPVPLCLFDPGGRTLVDRPAAGLANVAATALGLLGYDAPDGFEPSLLGPVTSRAQGRP